MEEKFYADALFYYDLLGKCFIVVDTEFTSYIIRGYPDNSGIIQEIELDTTEESLEILRETLEQGSIERMVSEDGQPYNEPKGLINKLIDTGIIQETIVSEEILKQLREENDLKLRYELAKGIMECANNFVESTNLDYSRINVYEYRKSLMKEIEDGANSELDRSQNDNERDWNEE